MNVCEGTCMNVHAVWMCCGDSVCHYMSLCVNIVNIVCAAYLCECMCAMHECVCVMHECVHAR